MTWAEATTFNDLAALNMRFIRGEIDHSPTYGGPISSETSAIRESLIALNQQGLFTTGSQPAVSDGRYQQRAWVEGFASEDTARRLAEKELYSELIVRVFEPMTECFCRQMPITQREGRPCTWAGSGGRVACEEMEIWTVECQPQAVVELFALWYVVAIDPAWGRRDYLWQMLLEPHREGYCADPLPDVEGGK